MANKPAIEAAKHTPTYEVDEHDDGSYTVTMDDDSARLLDAAPDLLAACKELIDADDSFAAAHGGHLDLCRLRQAKDAIRAAIAKAKGGEGL